jgi:hypothetical protein
MKKRWSVQTPNLFIIIKFDRTQLSYNPAYGGRSASVEWCTIVCSKAVLSHVALRHDNCTVVSYWFFFSPSPFLIWWGSFSLFVLVHTGLLFTCSCHGASERQKLSHTTVSLTTLSVCWLWRWRQKVLLKHCVSKRLHVIIPYKTNRNMYLLCPLCFVQIMALTRVPFCSVICFPAKFRVRH